MDESERTEVIIRIDTKLTALTDKVDAIVKEGVTLRAKQEDVMSRLTALEARADAIERYKNSLTMWIGLLLTGFGVVLSIIKAK